MRPVPSAIVAAAVLASPAVAQSGQSWTALDRVTLSSTGSLTVGTDSMTFDIGGTIHVKLIEKNARGLWSETQKPQQGDIYKVDPPAKPSSARGDVLCDKPVTFIVLSHPVPGDLDLSAYSGPGKPKADGSVEPCATFSYTEG